MAFLGLGVFYTGVIVGIPVVTGVAEGVHHQKEQNKEAANSIRMVKFHIYPSFTEKSPKTDELKDTIVVIHKGRLWLWNKDEESGFPKPLAPDIPPPHPFEGFYIMYPDEDRNPRERGLVSTISRDPPMLNWIFADKDDMSFRHGNKSGSMPHQVGSWDWTEDEAWVTLQDCQNFVAVEVDEKTSREADGLKWQLYYDMYGDKMDGGRDVGGRPVLELAFNRVPLPDELRRAQEEEAENKMQVKSSGDLKTKMDYR